MKDVKRLIRKHVKSLHAYTPGEQPKRRNLLKLNTNENPWPPSPNVIQATKNAVDDRLRLYPDPEASKLRAKLAKLHRVDASQICIGNGSDDILAMCLRAFVEPSDSVIAKTKRSKATVQFFDPSYSLYPVLAETHKAHINKFPLKPDFDIPSNKELKDSEKWDFDAALTYVTTPNAPSGRGYENEQLISLCQSMNGVVVLDEAYVDFADQNALRLVDKFSNVMVTRTFSKSYSLCFQRVGYATGHPDLIHALDKVRDSYNVNGLGQIAAVETLKNIKYYKENFNSIIDERERLSSDLQEIGFSVLPSQTNFVFTIPPKKSARKWFELFREKGIIVRFFDKPRLNKYLRITIGSPGEMKRFLSVTKRILKSLQ